jgi:YbgC/YbaW family acyl-CoA thioester hydrolase
MLEELAMLEPFVMAQRVRPRHCDAQAMVYAGRYHEFCEDAFIGWLEHFRVSYASLRASDVDLVISESRYSYRRPARLDDELLIAVTAEMTTESTLTAHFAIRRGTEPLATAVISYVAVHDGHRTELPDALRSLVSRAAPDA